jgi:hypothetical protein
MEHAMSPTTPSADQVERVQAETGMDYLQAYRHLQGRSLAAQAFEQRRRDWWRAQIEAQRPGAGQ